MMSKWSSIERDMRIAIIKWILQSILGLVGYGVILFLPVGRLDWVWGWALLGVLLAFLLAHPLILVPLNPGLLVERQQGFRGEGVKAWDRWVAFFAIVWGMLVTWVVAGLDVRSGWTGSLLLVVHLIGLLVNIIGYAIFLWAMAANAFFSEGVRIQEDRGHSVQTGGPYKFVRHPGYAGALLSMISTPFLLGSLWALLPASIGAALYVLRTYLEDQTLQAELPGYLEYAQQTRYRLLPGVW